MNDLSVLQLPTDFPKTPSTLYQAGYCHFSFSERCTASLAALTQPDLPEPELMQARSHVVAALQALLYRYTQQEAFYIGVNVARGDRDAAIAPYDTTAVGAAINSELTTSALVSQISTALSNEANREAQVAVTFCHHRADQQAPDDDPTWVQAHHPQSSPAADWHLMIWPQGDKISGLWVYNANLFLPATLQRLSDHFQTVLTSVVAQPDLTIAQLPLLTAPEHQQLLVDWNSAAAHYPQVPIYHAIESHVVQYPEAIAITYQGQQLTYAELNQRANQLAHYLNYMGVQAGDRVAVCMQPSLDIGVALLGILKAGGVYVPLDSTHPPERLTAILEDTQASLLVTQIPLLSNLLSLIDPIVCLDEDWETIQLFSTHNPSHTIDLDQTAYIIYTSGTTGKPKGVMASHRNLVNYIFATQARLGFNRHDVMPAIARFTFSIALFELLSPLVAGGTLVILDREHVLDLPRMAQTLQQLTMLHTVPSLMQRLVSYIIESGLDRQKFQRVKHVFTGGDIVSPDLLEQLKAVFQNAQVAVLYGCSEVSSLCATFPVPRDRTLTKSCVGRPFNNVAMRLYDAHQNLVPIGIVGEIYVGGAGVTQGYLNREELTQEKFVAIDGQRFYRTGDLGRFDADGNVEFLGRADFQIKLRGIRIELGDIESTLRQAPSVREGVVMAQDLGSGENSLVAYVVLDQTVLSGQPQTAAIAAIRQVLTAKLPDYMVPTAFIVLEAMPLNPNQKVDRRALPQPTAEMLIGNTLVTPPANTLEQKLVAIWETVLGIQPIGVENGFFELGGNSLLAVQMLTQVDQELGKNLPITALLLAPTIRGLAQQMSQAPADWGAVELVALRRSGTKPPLFCIYGILLYQELAECLPTDRPVYAVYLQEEVDLLKSGSAVQSEALFDDVPSIAARYLRVIRTLQPHGPYHLAGESFGGVVAFEMAQQLHAAGEAIAFVALLDSEAPNFDVQLSLRQRLVLHSKLLLQQGPAYLHKRLRENLQTVKQKVSAVQASQASDIRAAVRDQASQAYFPQAYAGKLVLFRAMDRDPFAEESALNTRDLGWAALAAGGLEILDVPGDHLGILKSPNVQVMAAKMHDCMEAAIADASQPTAPIAEPAYSTGRNTVAPDRH